MIQSAIVILGLALFEIVSSIDNAIVNAHVLKTVPEQYRRFFLLWGLLFAVVLIRGVLPFVIVWLANTDMGLQETFSLAFSSPALMEDALEHSKPLLLAGEGVPAAGFLAWLFLEDKKYAFPVEQIIHRRGVWFHAVAAILLTAVTYAAVTSKTASPAMALAAQIGATAFFVTEGFRRNAEEAEEHLQGPNLSAWSKLLYLEVLDASFSIDGVIGAFAFTMAVPLILVGNGIGALVVREVTVRGIDVVSKFAYLKNGAMYSVGVLGVLMMAESFHFEFPFWMAPLNTLLILIVFMGLSIAELRKNPPV